eukprot:TRINITY_DN75949_c0_g1_i1.p2 TRINITY_DN75949_c0_g1~~TRINITY_DN75949_c0_g1_i1.p2  ORF type:complete len:225 (-),score=53.84 TRINITY_DN75949_c0_g1_i1:126-740(-)
MAEPSLKDRCVDWVIEVAKHGGDLWMVGILLGVCILNSVTGGTLIWSVGILQASLFPIIVLSRDKFSFVLAPLAMSVGSLIGGYFYIQLMNSSGADALLEKTGAKDSKWMATTQAWAQDYGVLGLLALQIAPIPIPTAVLVVTGKLAKIVEWKIMSVVFFSKFAQLTLGGIALRYTADGMTPEQYVRMNFKGEAPPAESESKKD